MSSPTASERRRTIAASLVATLATSPGQTYLIAAFYSSWTVALDLSKTRLSAAYALGTLCASFLLVFVGRASDRFGPRRTMIAVTAALGLACMGTSRVSSLAGLFVAFFSLRLLGQGSLSLVSAHAIALVFRRKLGSVEGLRNGAISVAVALLPPVAVYLISELGWRSAYVVLGVGVWLTALPCAIWLLPERPARPAKTRSAKARAAETQTESRSVDSLEEAAGSTLREAAGARAYWTMAAIVIAHAMIVTALHFHLQPMAGEIGLGAPQAAAAMASYALASLVATLVGGQLADRWPPSALFAISVSLLGASSLVLWSASSALGVHAALGVLGLAQGLVSVTVGPTVADFFGRAHFGEVRGSLVTLGVAGAAAGPLIAGALADRYGGFGEALLLFAAVCAPLFFAAARLGAPRARATMGA